MSYHNGTDVLVGDLGARDLYEDLDLLGANPTAADLAELQRGIAQVDKAAAEALAAQKQPKPVSFLQKEAFGGLKVWQAGALGAGVIGVLSGLAIALVRRK